MHGLWKLLIVMFICISVVVGQRKEGEDCQLSNGKFGVCKLILGCQQAVDDIRKGIFPQPCGFIGTKAVVCCELEIQPSATLSATPALPVLTSAPTTKPTPVPILGASRKPGEISNQKCLEYSQYVWKQEWSSISLVDEGDKKNGCPFDEVGHSTDLFASRREFPHMAQLAFEGDEGLVWTCGGSLISEQYVLTTAHCLLDRTLGYVKYVRMGIVDLDNEDHKQQFEIIERISHPEYKPPSRYHDIGLAKLHKKAELNTWVRPGCLSTSDVSPGSTVMVSGWGLLEWTGTENKKLKRIVQELYDQPKCNETYKKESKVTLPNGIRDDIMICAGHPTEVNRNTCQGDSGGPLVVYRYGHYGTCVYDIIGIVDFGKACGIYPDIPDVYTRVSYYNKWIEDIVWPTTA